MAIYPVIRAFGAALAVVLAVALGFFSTLFLLDRRPERAPAASGSAPMASGPTRCEVELGPERCPGLPSFEPAKQSRAFNDNWDGSSTSMERCLRRAAEFRSACKGQSPVTARFYLGDQVVRAQTQP